MSARLINKHEKSWWEDERQPDDSYRIHSTWMGASIEPIVCTAYHMPGNRCVIVANLHGHEIRREGTWSVDLSEQVERVCQEVYDVWRIAEATAKRLMS